MDRSSMKGEQATALLSDDPLLACVRSSLCLLIPAQYERHLEWMCEIKLEGACRVPRCWNPVSLATYLQCVQMA